jgi:glutaredoxin
MEIESLSNEFTIYSKSGCFYCSKAKTLLKEKKLEHTIINCDEYILEDKEIFLTLIETDDHDKIWVFLIEKITNIENKVAIAIKKFGTELELDICDFIEIKK